MFKNFKARLKRNPYNERIFCLVNLVVFLIAGYSMTQISPLSDTWLTAIAGGHIVIVCLVMDFITRVQVATTNFKIRNSILRGLFHCAEYFTYCTIIYFTTVILRPVFKFIETSDTNFASLRQEADQDPKRDGWFEDIATIAAERHEYGLAYEYSLKYCKYSVSSCNNAAKWITKDQNVSEQKKQEAISLSQRALDADPTNPNYLKTYAAALALNGKSDEAAKVESQAIEAMRKRWSRKDAAEELPRMEAEVRSYQSRNPAGLSK